jgi:hypothetical protein
MTVRQTDPPGLKHKARVAVQRNKITVGFVLALLLSTVALGLVLAEQDRGRERDDRQDRFDRALALSIAVGRQSRIENVDAICQAQITQNRIILAILEVSYAQSPGVTSAETQIRRLAQPLRPRLVRRECRRQKAKIRSAPQPTP